MPDLVGVDAVKAGRSVWVEYVQGNWNEEWRPFAPDLAPTLAPGTASLTAQELFSFPDDTGLPSEGLKSNPNSSIVMPDHPPEDVAINARSSAVHPALPASSSEQGTMSLHDAMTNVGDPSESSALPKSAASEVSRPEEDVTTKVCSSVIPESVAPEVSNVAAGPPLEAAVTVPGGKALETEVSTHSEGRGGGVSVEMPITGKPEAVVLPGNSSKRKIDDDDEQVVGAAGEKPKPRQKRRKAPEVTSEQHGASDLKVSTTRYSE